MSNTQLFGRRFSDARARVALKRVTPKQVVAFRVRQAFAVLFIGFIITLPFVGAASAGNPIGGEPSLDGAILADHSQVLAFFGTISWGGAYAGITNGSYVYAGTIVLFLFDLTQSNLSVYITATQFGTTTTAQVEVIPGIGTQDSINLASGNSWNPVEITVGGTAQYYQVAVPISLLPNSIANVGGLDMLTLAIISECIVGFAAAFFFAWRVMQRALWAPPFSLLIWGHVIILAILGAVLLDYQWVDQTFAGWSPLVYAFTVAPMMWAFALSLFNRTRTAIILRANTPLAGRLSYHAWFIEVGVDAKGRTVLIQPTWGGFWARYWNKHVVLSDVESSVSQPEPFVADIINHKVLSRQQILRRVRRPSPAKGSPLDDFEVIPASLDGRSRRFHRKHYLPERLYWTPTGQPVEVEWPKLTMHTVVAVAAKTSPEGGVVVPAHNETFWTWPHYTEGSAKLVLHSMHYRSAMSVVAGWRSAEQLSKILSDTALDLEALKGNFDTEVAMKVRERITARLAVLGRTQDDLDELEAAQEAERIGKDDKVSLDQLYGPGPVSHGLEDVPKRERKR